MTVTRRGFIECSLLAPALIGKRAVAAPAASLVEPYGPLAGGQFDGPAVHGSSDPLVRYRWSNPTAADPLQIYILSPVSFVAHTPGAFDNLESALKPESNVGVMGTGSVRFDFGVESAAWLEFDSPDFSGSVEMSVGEYRLPEVVNESEVPGQDPVNRFKTAVPQQYGDTFRLELNSELYEGVRFGWIHVRQFQTPWHITGVRVVCQAKPTNYLGAFSCSDSLLTRVWYTGAYTVRVNFNKDYFGAILIDRGDRISFTGDSHPAQAAALVAFGNWDFVLANLTRTATDSNGIASYSLYWIFSLLDYYHYTGDVATLQNYVSNADAKLQDAASQYDDPTITFYGHDERLGAAFVEASLPETRNAFRLLFIQACVKFSDAMGELGRFDLQQQYSALAAGKMALLRAQVSWYEPFGVHAMSEIINSGLTTADEQTAMFDREFSDRLNRLSYSPFNQYFIMQALARMGRYDEALTTVRDHWGGQIRYGGTTFFEVYRHGWNERIGENGPVPNCQVGFTSLAHAWGGGVTAWLTQEILGIKPTAPGFTSIDIVPHLGSTLTWVAGTSPTPRGPVSARFDLRTGEAEIEIPQGSTARIGLPVGGRVINNFSIRRRESPGAEFASSTLEKDHLFLHGVKPGRYDIAISYAGPIRPVTTPPLAYPLSPAREDTRTSGNWGGVYGQDGYVLFNYDGVGQDRTRLPSYVTSVAPWTGFFGGVLLGQPATNVTDQRAPAPDAGNGAVRNVGYFYTDGPHWWGMTMSVDVTVQAGSKYQLALYFLDWEDQKRWQNIEVFDLDTRKLIMPVVFVKEFAQGKYTVLQCDRSVRVRINDVRRLTAVLNALFFDPSA